MTAFIAARLGLKKGRLSRSTHSDTQALAHPHTSDLDFPPVQTFLCFNSGYPGVLAGATNAFHEAREVWRWILFSMSLYGPA